MEYDEKSNRCLEKKGQREEEGEKEGPETIWSVPRSALDLHPQTFLIASQPLPHTKNE